MHVDGLYIASLHVSIICWQILISLTMHPTKTVWRFYFWHIFCLVITLKCNILGLLTVKNEWWDADLVMCLDQGTDLLMSQLIPLPLTVSCSGKFRLVLPFWCWLTQVVPDKIQEGVKRFVCVWPLFGDKIFLWMPPNWWECIHSMHGRQ